ncbi:hypothetical protein C7B62_22175 [Pleurocapsa sp. CCALA 161]|uniref:hypothetical protein n=1 Tax=Pleurocapsa sp. CCALA 161 TaxID=2107688 RepID=UPI000D06B572|nr:hypothetical protein [Pleurocapsa sp. CCALA 161]PSB06683.1 hypothetical protein C7B62_22175 [Pleurocapsa sp. CCALA 161]
MFNSAEPVSRKPKLTWASNINLIILAFCLVFYGRIFITLTSAPAILIHAHFVVVPLIMGIALATATAKNSQQSMLVHSLLGGMLIFLIAILVSAIWNRASFINAIISFMMLGEPMMFLVTIVCIPMSVKSFSRLKNWLMASVGINFLLAAVQKPLIDGGKIDAQGFDGTDGCGGVFFVSGAGNYVSASVSLAFALYFLANGKNFPLWVRVTTMLAASWQLLFSDSKQLIFAYFLAWIILIIFNFKDVGKTIQLLLGIMITGMIFFWCVQNLEAFNAFTAWARPDLYGKNGDAWFTKLYSVKAILAEFKSPANWLFGLGPGHTVSRLGAWFLQDYSLILKPLGATTTSIGVQSREFIDSFWLATGSSLFSPIFGWAGIWGDLGLLGLGAYMYLASLIWQYFGVDNSLKITLLATLVLGFVFTQLEEPGYMLFLSMLLGLAWHEKRLKFEQQAQV